MAPDKLYLIKIMYFWKLIVTLVITWFVMMITTNAFAEMAAIHLGYRNRTATNTVVIIGCIIQILCLGGIIAAVIVNIWYPF